MPLSRYDKLMGGKGSAQKTYDAMCAKYGHERGKQVFYATVNKRRGRDGKPAR